MPVDYENPVAIGELVQDCESWRDQHVAGWKRRIARFTGTGYCAVQPESVEDWRDLFYAKYLSVVVPRLSTRTPRYLVTTGMPELFGADAIGIQSAFKNWAEITKISELNNELAYDYLMLWAVTLETNEPIPGGETDDPWAWPQATRIPPEWWFCEAYCHSKNVASIQGHQWIIEYDELCERAEADEEFGWDIAACMRLKPMSADTYKKLGKGKPLSLGPKQVLMKDLWFPGVVWETKEGDVARGINGGKMTIGVSGAGKVEICQELRPFYGGRKGPYSLYGYHKVPNSPYPLSPLVAIERSIEDKNKMRASSLEAAAKYQRGVVVGGPQSKQLAAKIESDQRRFWIYDAGADFDKNRIQGIEIGGLSQQNIVAEDNAATELELASGLTETLQGRVQGSDTTATDVNEATNAALGRIDGVTSRFASGQEDTAKGIGFYFMFDERVVIPTPDEATAEQPNPVWQGGVTPAQGEVMRRLQDPMDAMQIRIKPFSGAPISAAQQAANAELRMRIAAEIAPTMPLNPHVRWKDTLRAVGEARNDEGLEEMIDYAVLAKQTELAQQSAQTTLEQPRVQIARAVMGRPGQQPGARPRAASPGLARSPTRDFVGAQRTTGAAGGTGTAKVPRGTKMGGS